MTHINFIGWFAVIISVIAFKVAYELVKPLAVKQRFLGFLLLAVPGLPAVLYAVYYLHVLPEWAWFYELRSWRGSEFLAVPMGAAAGCLAAILPRMTVALVLLASIGIAAVPYLKPVFFRIPEGSIGNHWKEDACMQSTPSTCGPASLTTIFRNQGAPTTEREVAVSAFTCSSGTEAWYLARYARSHGLTARFDFRPGLPEDLKLPAMIGVRLGDYGHFVPVLSRKGSRITIADPLAGLETIELEVMSRRYQFTGFHLSVSRD